MDVDEKRGKFSIPAALLPFFASKNDVYTIRIQSCDKIMAISLDRSDLLISLTGSICPILREIYDPRAVEKLRVSIRVRSFVAVIEAI